MAMFLSEDMLKAIVVAILSGFFGAWLTSIRAKWTAFSADYSKRLEQAFTLVDHFAECACIWWEAIEPADKLKCNPSYIVGLKVKLATLIISMNKDYPRFNSKSVDGAYHALTRACTGGDFPKRSAEVTGQATEILRCAELLKAELFAVRRRDYTMHLTMKK